MAQNIGPAAAFMVPFLLTFPTAIALFPLTTYYAIKRQQKLEESPKAIALATVTNRNQWTTVTGGEHRRTRQHYSVDVQFIVEENGQEVLVRRAAVPCSAYNFQLHEVEVEYLTGYPEYNYVYTRGANGMANLWFFVPGQFIFVIAFNFPGVIAWCIVYGFMLCPDPGSSSCGMVLPLAVVTEVIYFVFVLTLCGYCTRNRFSSRTLPPPSHVTRGDFSHLLAPGAASPANTTPVSPPPYTPTTANGTTAEEPIDQGPASFCTNCGTKAQPGYKFCGSCGTSLA